MLFWTGMAALLGPGFFAGLYYALFQQRWYIHIGSFSHTFVYLKNWFDGGMGIFGHVSKADYAIWRHGVRNEGEPAFWAVLGVMLLAKVKAGAKPVSKLTLAVMPLVMLIAITGGALAITWVISFGPLHHVNDRFQWQQIILGLTLGHLLHIIWAPTGRTIRMYLVERSAGMTPLWVILPLAPPPWREQWAELAGDKLARREKHPRWLIFSVFMASFLFVLIAIGGDLAKYWISRGNHVPYMNP